MDREPPILHALPGPTAFAAEPPAVPWHRSTRARLFAVSFGSVTAVEAEESLVAEFAHERDDSAIVADGRPCVGVDVSGERLAGERDVSAANRDHWFIVPASTVGAIQGRDAHSKKLVAAAEHAGPWTRL